MSFFFALGHKCYHTCENTPLVLTTHIAKTFVSSGFYHACLVTVNRFDYRFRYSDKTSNIRKILSKSGIELSVSKRSGDA